MKHSFPKARYHVRTGQMILVMSAEEDAALGKEWSAPQGDVRFSRNPAPANLPEPKYSVVSIDLPEVE